LLIWQPQAEDCTISSPIFSASRLSLGVLMIEVDAKFPVLDEEALQQSNPRLFTGATIVDYVLTYSALVEGRLLPLSLDSVQGLSFYVELEITCDASERDAATDAIFRMAERMVLSDSERRSYLELFGFC